MGVLLLLDRPRVGRAPVITTRPRNRRGDLSSRHPVAEVYAGSRRPERCGGVYQDQCEGLLLCDGRQRQSRSVPTSRSDVCGGRRRRLPDMAETALGR
ncbi:MAG: hypothetical protein ACLRMJ_09965 [Alistipes finegoldii]